MRLRWAPMVLLCVIDSPAHAGVFADDLSRCLVSRASDADQDAFLGWMFSAVSANPKLEKLTVLNRTKRDELARSAAAVFERLLLTDCRKESVAALKAEGEGALAQSFSTLGQSAARQLFGSSQAQAELESFGKNFDDGKIRALAAEAGITIRDTK